MKDNIADLTYFYEIQCLNGKTLYLTSSNIQKEFNNNIYKPNSGLSLEKCEFNDSAQNHFILHGIYEKNGVERKDDIKNSKIKILYAKNKIVKHMVTYECTKIISEDLEFKIICESEGYKYNQVILKKFSKTCRASFGDDKCKVSINDYAVKANIIHIDDNIIRFNFEDIKDNHFNGGNLKMFGQDGEMYKFKIISNAGNNVIIVNDENLDLRSYNDAILYPACDKNYRTCCYSYNNAVNFRGEPFIPEDNIIQN